MRGTSDLLEKDNARSKFEERNRPHQWRTRIPTGLRFDPVELRLPTCVREVRARELRRAVLTRY